MSGPVVGGLVNKFGCRPVCICGSIVACIGLCLSILSPNVPVLMLTYGVIGGFGLGLIYLPAVVAVGYYFESKRALATGISVCGSGVGTFLFAPLATYLLEQYGWKGSNLIFAGLCLNCAVFGALMRPLELKAKVIEPDVILEEDEEDEDEGAFKFKSDGDKKQHDPLLGSPNHDPGVSSSLHLNENPRMVQVPTLPTITEQSVTAAMNKKEDRPKITDVFPDQEVSETSVNTAEGQYKRRKSSRIRTISESASNRFQLTPIKTKLGKLRKKS